MLLVANKRPEIFLDILSPLVLYIPHRVPIAGMYVVPLVPLLANKPLSKGMTGANWANANYYGSVRSSEYNYNAFAYSINLSGRDQKDRPLYG